MNRISPYASSRRRFLQGVGAAAGMFAILRGLERVAEGAPSPKRLLIIQRPVGTVYENWWPQGSGTDFTLSRILRPFESVRDRMVVLRDLKLPYEGSVGGGHERGTVLMATGQRTKQLYPGNGGDDPMAEGASIDQLLVKQSTDLQGTPIASLQISCDKRADTPEVSTRHMSYSGPRAPMTPYYQPLEVYQRVFGTLMPGGTTSDNLEALARARRQKKSVLDFARKDLARLHELAPSAQREMLDAHTEAIREVEKEFDADPRSAAFCGMEQPPEVISVSEYIDPYSSNHVVRERDDEKHARIGALHFAVLKAAFRCDITRVVTFQWAPGTNHVSFGDFWPPDSGVFKVHHTTSHDPDTRDTLEFLTRVEEFYAGKVAGFLKELADTQDVNGGTLLDNTVVPYVTEVGTRTHNWDRVPWVLFGGASTGLVGGRVWDNGGRGLRSTNDLWMACAGAFGLPDFVLGDADLHTTAIPGLFA
ncbi:hypothetical protein SOCE26_066410 [Sorangium cellulosum]|uniref:DUF1552 domain-containing protein n=1 Tax=Sorangium cellulosum TaxID=56 RepID=A0A2L0F0S7_SORCE|nr:DUF1552 domain-containing protein [Sorangium cellulosum]AUX45160.1 hypothetical protein SOCE26_066410 [Sorangium cellulosum]